ncbi:hypothetical protein D3273_20015 [Lichenibacterium minor]|uniref:Uncharacterized protein n=1 Tax=Lichenibacterium minor TaxID=2316528 RepID=A0A4V1RU74_9HYPH|nr:hypothetical protein [Lichenibacterium minor]RYC30164.1 hypothetical protein D3273_20015 [Lichenibacterium minor]
MIACFETAMVEDRLTLPYAKQGLFGVVYENARVLAEGLEADGRIMQMRGLQGWIARLHNILSTT